MPEQAVRRLLVPNQIRIVGLLQSAALAVAIRGVPARVAAAGKDRSVRRAARRRPTEAVEFLRRFPQVQLAERAGFGDLVVLVESAARADEHVEVHRLAPTDQEAEDGDVLQSFASLCRTSRTALTGRRRS